MTIFHVCGELPIAGVKVNVESKIWHLSADLPEHCIFPLAIDLSREICEIMISFPTKDLPPDQRGVTIWLDITKDSITLIHGNIINPTALIAIIKLMYQAVIATTHFRNAIPYCSMFQKTTESCRDPINNGQNGCNCCIYSVLPILAKMNRTSNCVHIIRIMHEFHKTELSGDLSIRMAGKYQFYAKMVYLLYVTASVPITIQPGSNTFAEMIGYQNLLELCPDKCIALSISVDKYENSKRTLTDQIEILIHILAANI